VKQLNGSISMKYSATIFQGATISIDPNADVSHIEKLENVAAVHKVWGYPIQDQAGPAAARNTSYGQTSNHVKCPDASIPEGYEKYDIHRLTGVNNLHSRGIKGKGAKIGFVRQLLCPTCVLGALCLFDLIFTRLAAASDTTIQLLGVDLEQGTRYFTKSIAGTAYIAWWN
jgi:hypothetical protein